MAGFDGKLIRDEWAKRFAPGLLLETRTDFPLDPSLGIPSSPAPIEGVFTGKKPDFALGTPTAPTAAKLMAQTSFAPTPQAPSLENAVPQQPSDAIPNVPVGAGDTTQKDKGGVSPAAMGILGMGLSMAATPPRAVPYTNAEIIGRSGLAGLGFYEKALEDKRRQQALDVSAEEHRLTREDNKLYKQAQIENMQSQRRLESERIRELNDKREAEIRLLEEKAKDAARMNEPIGKNTLGIDPTWPNWKADKYKGNFKPPTAAGKTQSFTDDDGTVHVIDTSKPGAYPGYGKKTKEGAGSKPSQLAERMSLAEKALQDEYKRTVYVPSHGDPGATPPMTKQFTTGEIAAKAEEMFGKKTTTKAGAIGATTRQSLGIPKAGQGGAGKGRKVKMPNGQVWEFDAAGNRIR